MRFRHLGSLLLLLALLLAGCSRSAPADLTLKVKEGDSLRYEVKETMTASVVGEPDPHYDGSGTFDVQISIGAVDGSKANALCVVTFPNGNQWPVPVVLDTLTGKTTMREHALGLRPADLDVIYDQYMLALGARPGDTRTAVGDRWKGEMRQLPLGGFALDPVPLPLNLELVEVKDALATVRLWGKRKLDWVAEGKTPTRFTGTMEATGTMVIDLGVGLVESSEVEVVTKLKNSDDDRETEATNAITVRRVRPAY
ncbi:MAG: hypothetical protein K0R39_2078 [Symbiobacteriaceae bacterium]|jgi:hypothetical protein|nr:hypothetical protein [Symbiobacteriaceae bacterium]